MIKKIKNLMFSLVVTAGFMLPTAIALPTAVYAQANIQDSLCQGANLDANSTDCQVDPEEAGSTVNTILSNVINIFSIIVGVVSVIMIIVGGLKYITSGGDSGNVSGAKNTILYAIIGLVIVALAQVIVNFVLGRVSNATS
jgi:cytochrome bd-type quinol oxidase subunit 2